MIDIRKTYKTRDGRPVELLTTNARGAWPVIGYIGDSEGLRRWSHDGTNYNFSRTDALALVEVKPERVMWLNTYPNDYVYMYRSREEADANSAADRIARLKVEFAEGQFDE